MVASCSKRSVRPALYKLAFDIFAVLPYFFIELWGGQRVIYSASTSPIDTDSTIYILNIISTPFILFLVYQHKGKSALSIF
jgi:hypothetical protein